MLRRRSALIAAVALTATGFAVPAASARAADWVPSAGWQAGSASIAHVSFAAAGRHGAAGGRGAVAGSGAAAGAGTVPPGKLASCERQLLAAPDRATTPVMAVVGASFTAGVGPDNQKRSWAVLLARQLYYDAVIYGDAGAGYVRTGIDHGGPMSAELRRIALRAISPELVIVQAGHDDTGVPAALEQERVRQAIALIRADAPRARIALLTVFPGRRNQAAAVRTDQAIVTAAKAADHDVIIMDPLTGHWQFPHVADGLHPTPAGDAWIAARVDGLLTAAGVRPATIAGSRSLLICDEGVGVPSRIQQPPSGKVGSPRKSGAV